MTNQQYWPTGPNPDRPADQSSYGAGQPGSFYANPAAQPWQGQPNPSTKQAQQGSASPHGPTLSTSANGQPNPASGQPQAAITSSPTVPGPQPTQPWPGQGNQPRPFHAPQRTGDFRPAGQRAAREVGAPIAVLVLGSLGAFGLAALSGYGNPVAFLLGMIPSVIGLAIGLGCYLWLDRWEPEPPRLLFSAFLWGGGVSTIAVLVIGWIFGAFGVDSLLFAVVVQAPIFEEAMKGAWLLIMLTGARRREMTTLTDHLVYAGFAAFGFAFVENLMYFSSADSVDAILQMTLIRTGLNLFGHALYTSATAIGIYYARRGRDKLNPGPVILGYLVAVLLHALWNGAAFLGFAVLGGVYLVLLVPAFIYVVRLGIKSRNEEGAIVGRQLDRMVFEGIVSQPDAAWLRQLESRSQVHKQQDKKTPEGKRIRMVADAVTELAIVRDRLANMPEPSPYLIEEERWLVGALQAESGRHPAPQMGAAMPPSPVQPPQNHYGQLPQQPNGPQNLER